MPRGTLTEGTVDDTNAPSTVPLALTAMQEAETVLSRWKDQLATAASQLEAVEADMGGSALDAVAAEDVAAALAQARAARDVAAAAVREATGRLQDARRNVLLARVGELRGQAQSLHRQADERQVRTDELLAELSQWEVGAEYVVREPWMDEIRGLSPSAWRRPRTLVMRFQAAELDEQAARLEEKARTANAEQLAATCQAVSEQAAGGR